MGRLKPDGHGKLSALEILDKCPHLQIESCDGARVCSDCGTEVGRIVAIPREEGEDGQGSVSKFGRGPNSAIVMDNNLGTAPGPERNRQVMSALNSAGDSKKEGLEFHVGKLDLLTLWKMSGDPTDHAVSEIVSRMVKRIEKVRSRHIPKERVSFIAQSCKLGIKNAEKVKRLTPREMRFIIESQFEREGLLSP